MTSLVFLSVRLKYPFISKTTQFAKLQILRVYVIEFKYYALKFEYVLEFEYVLLQILRFYEIYVKYINLYI